MMPPLLGHLADLCREAPAESFILGGGLALMVRREHLLRTNAQTLARLSGHEIPESRVTTDIDMFLRLQVLARGDRRVRDAIDVLGYSERTPKWQFEKPLLAGPDPVAAPGRPPLLVVLDLLASSPDPASGIKVRPPRVGSGSAADLHGRLAEEAFAVERIPVATPVYDGSTSVTTPLVAHPFALMSMKVRACHDWLRYQTAPWQLGAAQTPPSAKHAFDVALSVAMLRESELDECRSLAAEFAEHPVAVRIRSEALGLYGSTAAAGWREAVRQGMFDDHDLVWSVLRDALGVSV